MTDEELIAAVALDPSGAEYAPWRTPQRFLDARLDQHPDAYRTQVEGFVQNWVADPFDRFMLFIYGPKGPGKTHLAVAAARELLIADARGPMRIKVRPCLPYNIAPIYMFGMASWVMEQLRPQPDHLDQQNLAWLVNTGIDLLDDWGVEKPTDAADKMLFTIFDKRYADCLLTIVTSNLSPAQIAERGERGERLADRLDECAVALHYDEPSRRRNR